jgi:hypothetical protein
MLMHSTLIVVQSCQIKAANSLWFSHSFNFDSGWPKINILITYIAAYMIKYRSVPRRITPIPIYTLGIFMSLLVGLSCRKEGMVNRGDWLYPIALWEKADYMLPMCIFCYGWHSRMGKRITYLNVFEVRKFCLRRDSNSAHQLSCAIYYAFRQLDTWQLFIKYSLTVWYFHSRCCTAANNSYAEIHRNPKLNSGELQLLFAKLWTNK